MTRAHQLPITIVTLGLTGLLLGGAWPALAQSTTAATPESAAGHGIDVADIDLSVSPRVDFYQFANGGWLERSTIPDDRTQVRTLSQLTDQTIAQQIELLRVAAGPADAVAGSDEAKAAVIVIW